jgi:hypothetical protein
MSKTPLEERVMELEETITELGQLVVKMRETRNLMLRDTQKDRASFKALTSIVMELAVKAGVAPDKLNEHYKTRFTFWHANILAKIETSHPGIAAELDDRTIDNCNTARDYPSLFDDPPKGEV